MDTVTAFAVLALVSWDHNQVEQSWLLSGVSLSGTVPQPAATCPTSPFRASNGCDVCVSPTAGTRLCCQHNSPNHSFRQLRWWAREFRSSLFDRCTLHLDPHNLLNSDQ